MYKTDILKYITLSIVIIFLSACSGGDSSPDSTTQTSNSSNWDEMVWDQDNWK